MNISKKKSLESVDRNMSLMLHRRNIPCNLASQYVLILKPQQQIVISRKYLFAIIPWAWPSYYLRGISIARCPFLFLSRDPVSLKGVHRPEIAFGTTDHWQIIIPWTYSILCADPSNQLCNRSLHISLSPDHNTNMRQFFSVHKDIFWALWKKLYGI